MGRRVLTGGVVALMAIGSLALWIAIPAAWMWVTREIDGGVRFVIVVFGCIASMAGAAVLLYRLQDALDALRGTPEREAGPPAWLRPASGKGPAAPVTLLDVLLVVSAVAAVLALVLWWAFFADSSNPSGPLQPL